MGIFDPSVSNFSEGEEVFLNQIINLILNPETTAEERQILLQAKKEFEEKASLAGIINRLLNFLTPAAVNQRLSSEVSAFYTKLYRNRSSLKSLESGIAGSLVLMNIFG